MAGQCGNNRDSGVLLQASGPAADDPPQTVRFPQLRCSLMISPEQSFGISPSLLIHLERLAKNVAGARVCCGMVRIMQLWSSSKLLNDH